MRKYLMVIMIFAFVGAFEISSALGSDIFVSGINNKCNEAPYSKIGDVTATPGTIFLVIGINVKYSGDESFSVDPSYFQLVLSNTGYSNAGATYYLGQEGLAPLPSVTLYKGGSAEGYIAYEVPANTKDESYQIKYTGWDTVTMNDYRCD
jgi:hypothetical protein